MNVLVVVTDRKIANSTEKTYDANVISTSDYYPFGIQKKDRSLTEMAFYDKYRYGFNGMEKDDEQVYTGSVNWLKTYNLRQVQYNAGHRYISTTESYLDSDIEQLSKEVLGKHPLGG